MTIADSTCCARWLLLTKGGGRGGERGLIVAQGWPLAKGAGCDE